MTEAVGAYLDRIGATPVLSREAERALARRARLGREADARIRAGHAPPGDAALADDGAAAHRTLFESNLKLVVSIAKRYPTNQRIELIDLIQEGNISLDHAIRKFDERRGFKFSTYAVDWIRQGIGRALDRHSGTAKLPIETAAQVRAAMRDAAGDGDALPPGLRRAADAWLGVSLDTLATGDEAGPALGELLADTGARPDEQVVERCWQHSVVEATLQPLDETARIVLIRYFGLDGCERMPLSAVARSLSMSRAAVTRIVQTSLAAAADRLVDQVEPDPVGGG